MSELSLSLTMKQPALEQRQPSDFPYDHIRDYQNWRKAVTKVENTEIDPHTGSSKFRVDRQAKIVSAGSCFAQRIATEHILDWHNSLPSVWPLTQFLSLFFFAQLALVVAFRNRMRASLSHATPAA